MGLAASQTRYLALTARKSDLEYQAQVINTRRTELAEKSAQISKAYAAGMANKLIRISHSETTDGTTTKVWEELTFNNLLAQGYQIIGANGASLVPSPYTKYEAGSTISALVYKNLTESQKEKCTGNGDGTYTISSAITTADPSYNGMDIQTLLVSGQAQIVSKTFYDYLVEHGYGSGRYIDDKGNETSYAALLDQFESNAATINVPTIIDWRSDTTSTFKQNNYTEDDAQVSANYEAATAEIQAQDKMLELEVKNIETEHKAVETEMESVKKVIDKNIENSFKSFA